MEPYAEGMLAVGDGHEVHWETIGNPDGTPAVWLHGGPGSGTSAGNRKIFDPALFRAVFFDQRGCGLSTPLAVDHTADLSANTTQHLVEDIEKLREHLGIESWVVVGGSWGSVLALAYAQQHPERVRALVIASVSTGARRETEWITQDMGRVFPIEWDEFVGHLPPADRDAEPAAGYAKLLASPDPVVREEAARAWCVWEDVHISLAPNFTPSLRYKSATFRSVFTRLVTHYWSNGSFLDGAPLLANMQRLQGIPGVLIHGRYDVSSPLDSAWRLHRAWPGSRLVVCGDDGHGGASMSAELRAAVASFAGGSSPDA